MAFFVNNQNVVLYSVIKKDDIFILNLHNTAKNSVESHKVKCPVPEIQNKSDDSNKFSIKEHHVVSVAISNCGKLLSACDSNNMLHLWEYDANVWNYKSQRKLIRKCQRIMFTNSKSEVIVADRSGDVYAFSVTDCQKEGKFLLGHISLIVDVAISKCDKYLITCDRDGKIRISCYPNCYNIYSYCLGHEEFVSTVETIQLSKEMILSASGDGTLRLWSLNGESVCVNNIFENEKMLKAVEHCKYNADSKPLLSCSLAENQTTFAVKNVRYTDKSKICAVLFYLVKGVALYYISESKDVCFNFIQFISCESIPFDVFFNAAGDLIILQKNGSKPYSYFKYLNKDKACFEESDCSALLLFKELETFCESVEQLYAVQDDCEMLFKRNFDDKDDCKDSKKCSTKKSKIT